MKVGPNGKHDSSFGKIRTKKSRFVSKKKGFTFSAIVNVKRSEPVKFDHRYANYCIIMKVFQDFMSKLDSKEKHESNFDNLCMKKGGSFQKERFLFLLKSSMGGIWPPNLFCQKKYSFAACLIFFLFCLAWRSQAEKTSGT